MTFELAMRAFNPVFMFGAASLLIKMIVLSGIILAVAGVFVFFKDRRSGSYAKGNFARLLMYYGPILTLMGWAYAAYVWFAVVAPDLRSGIALDLVTVWPTVNDSLVSLLGGGVVCLTGWICDGLLRRAR